MEWSTDTHSGAARMAGTGMPSNPTTGDMGSADLGPLGNLQIDPSLLMSLADDTTETQQAVVRIAVIGLGAVSAFHHVPGIVLEPRAKLVMVCDSDPELLRKRQMEWFDSVGRLKTTVDYNVVANDPEVCLSSHCVATC